MINYKVELNDIKIDLPIGIDQSEQGRTQPISIDITMINDVNNDHLFNNIDNCIDYSQVYKFIDAEWKNKPHTDLLEQLATELINYILDNMPVQKCTVTIHKPTIFNGLASPSITLEKSKD